MNIKYPNGKQEFKTTLPKTKTKDLRKSHLGVSFEDAINESNEYYLNKNIAVIYKKPTPIQVTKVDYPSRNKAKISEAFYKVPSTTDYNGIYKGKYIDFEAKSCHESSFAFQRIYVHQIEHLKKVKEHGGIAFLLIEFSAKKKVFVFPIEELDRLYQESLNGGRKSITYDTFVKLGYEVEISYQPRVDYIKVIDQVYFKNE